MAKFLITASYSAEGLKGLYKDKATGRRKISPVSSKKQTPQTAAPAAAVEASPPTPTESATVQ